MKCKPTQVPAAEDVDIPALQARYARERGKRMNAQGQAQYVRPTGGKVEAFSADPHLPVAARAPLFEDLDVAVLGAGWGGILASWHLVKNGVTDFRNIDSAGDFGGVWYWNRYPGVQCDNDAYCYLPLLEETGFLPSRKFSDGAEIYAYAKTVAEKGGFADRALFHTLVQGIVWDEGLKRWIVTTNRGDIIRARFVIVAAGVLNMPKLPRIPGIDSFEGRMFHTARWDYDYTGGSYGNLVLDKLADKTVAIIGTGATAIQAIPHLAAHAKHLYVLQRTPSSVDERPNPPTDADWAGGLKPGWQAERQANFHKAAMEAFGPGEPDLVCDIWTEIARNLAAELEAEGWPALTIEQFMSRREMVDYQVMQRLRQRVDALVDDPKTAEALKPYYRFLCKRPLSNNDYYPSFNRPNVTLVDVSDTQGVETLTAKGFVANGVEYPVDCIIFASGFEATSDLERRWGMDKVEGRGGISIYDHWRDGPKTLHGTMTNGFPNQFYIGYIQGALNASVTEQFGRQGEHIAHIIGQTLKRGATTVEPTKAAMDDYVATFESLEIDLSAFQAQCPPSYFNNEGDANPRWALFRSWGPGWWAFQDMLSKWRGDGKLEGLELDA